MNRALSRTDRELFEGSAESIASWIVDSAIWSDGACTWTVPHQSDAFDRRTLAYSTADGSIYGGSLGVGLFLAEMFRATRRAEFKRVAIGAYRHALRTTDLASYTPIGLFSGVSGLVYAGGEFARLFEDEEFAADAVRVAQRVRELAAVDTTYDVIGGAAGAVWAIRAADAVLGASLTESTLLALGEHLIERATITPAGWAWIFTVGSARHLAGLAHGSAGVGLALLEVFLALGDSRFRYTAEQAFAHEFAEFDSDERNWHDLRNNEVQRVLLGRAPDRHKGDPTAWERCFMTAWCHGAPGIGLARLRAWRYLADERWRAEAEIAVETTRLSVQRSDINYSLCHGAFGNAETLVEAASTLDAPDDWEAALECARRGCESFGDARRRWPSGSWGGMPDVGLLKGEAGIGLFLLRLTDETVRTPLVPRQREVPAVKASKDAGAMTLHARHVASTLPLTVQVLGSDSATVLRVLDRTQRVSSLSVEVLVEELWSAMREARADFGEVLRVAHALDLECVRLARRPIDFGWLALRRSQAARITGDLLGDDEVALSPSVTLAFDAVDATTAAALGLFPSLTDKSFVILHRSEHGVRIRRVNLLARLLLEATPVGGLSIAEVRRHVCKQVPLEDEGERAELSRRIDEQVRHFVRDGLVLLSRHSATSLGPDAQAKSSAVSDSTL